jgi:hypothetical protein
MLAHLWGGYHHLDIHRQLNLVEMQLKKGGRSSTDRPPLVIGINLCNISSGELRALLSFFLYFVGFFIFSVISAMYGVSTSNVRLKMV